MTQNVDRTASVVPSSEAGAPESTQLASLSKPPPSTGRLRLDVLAAPEHPLHAIRISKEILEAAEEIVGLSDGPGVETETLEFLIRFLLFAARHTTKTDA